MPDERRNERLARWIVSEALGCPVPRFDDGTRDAQVDAEIHLPSGGRAGLEIVSDQDATSNSQWAALEKHGHKLHAPTLQHQWYAMLAPRAKVKDAVKALADLVLRVERGDLVWPRWGEPEEFERIGVTSLRRSDVGVGGVIYLFAEPLGGWAGDPLLNPWIDGMFERHPDVPRKLSAHPTSQGHAFLWVTMTSDFAIQHTLEDRGQEPPVDDTPSLPEGVTHVWVAGSSSSQGVLAWFPDRGWWRTPWRWSERDALVIPDDI